MSCTVSAVDEGVDTANHTIVFRVANYGGLLSLFVHKYIHASMFQRELLDLGSKRSGFRGGVPKHVFLKYAKNEDTQKIPGSFRAILTQTGTISKTLEPRDKNPFG